MTTYHFDTIVETDGSVRISGLPPHQQVEIVVLERPALPSELQAWIEDIRGRHPFAKMSKVEVLDSGKQTGQRYATEQD